MSKKKKRKNRKLSPPSLPMSRAHIYRYVLEKKIILTMTVSIVLIYLGLILIHSHQSRMRMMEDDLCTHAGSARPSRCGHGLTTAAPREPGDFGALFCKIKPCRRRAEPQSLQATVAAQPQHSAASSGTTHCSSIIRLPWKK